MRIPPDAGKSWWSTLALQVLPPFVESRDAVVWPEVQSALTEGSWIRDYLDPDFPATYHIDVHHLRPALKLLTPRFLTATTVTLQRRAVTSWSSTAAVTSRGRMTDVLAAGASKRRTYRRLLSWTGDVSLCGAVAEAVVDATLDQLRGKRLWKHPYSGPGQVDTLVGRPLQTGGPLDAAGAWPVDSVNLGAGWTEFAVEVKNVRSILYPYDHDVWDLLAKLGAFPDVLPVLVARRLHFTTFRMFKDLGVLGHDMRAQHFSTKIDAEDFTRVTASLGLNDARRTEPTNVPAHTLKWFGETGPRYAAGQLEKWARAAPIVDSYRELRTDLDENERRDLWREFVAEIVAAGLYQNGGWGPQPVEEKEEEEDGNWWEDVDPYDY